MLRLSHKLNWRLFEMSKKNFVSLILAVFGTVLFALGMCMTLLPEWGVFTQGIWLGCTGAAVMLVIPVVRCKMAGKPIFTSVSSKGIAAVLLGVTGTLVFGTGMCMVMIWEMLLWGIAVGLAGILLLLCLIPCIKGVK